MSSIRSHSQATQQSTGDTQHNVRDAALRGAALAFSKPPVKPKPQANTYVGGSNGALLAAAKVGTGRPSDGAGDSLQRDLTGGSSASRSVSRPAFSKSSSSSTLGVPNDAANHRAPSPSNIAAKLAAARSSPMKPTPEAPTAPVISARNAQERDVLPPTGSVGDVLAQLEPRKAGQQQQRKGRDGPASHSAARAAPAAHTPTDDKPIPPTTSLVKMFEQNRPTTPTQSPAAPVPSVSRSSPPPVQSPKPQRRFQLPPESMGDLPFDRTSKPAPNLQVDIPPSQFSDGAKDPARTHTSRPPVKPPTITQKPAQFAVIKTRTTSPPDTLSQRAPRTRPKSQDFSRVASVNRRLSTYLDSQEAPPSPASFKSAKEEQESEEEEKQKPSVPPPRRSGTRKPDAPVPKSTPIVQPATPLQTQPRKQGQSVSPMAPPEYFSQHLSAGPRPTSAMSLSPGSVYHNPYQRSSAKEITKHMTGESLSSAIMGAALASASSRTASPTPSPMAIEPLFPPRKHHHHHHSPFGRPPSPQKQSPPKATGKLRATMRKDPSSSDDEDKTDRYKRKGTRIMGIKGRKHPNKHHEGERKRWRDQMTERERKRYEGVWAANRGLLIPSTTLSPTSARETSPNGDDPSQDVSNLVVKDIWQRSRLPDHVLEEVWALVDSGEVGRLKRDEFVVGLWLIDQRLKGRKLPPRISESVWASARGLGIKIRVR